MPAAEDDGKVRIPLLDGSGDLDGLADHGAGDEGDPETHGVADLLKDTLFVLGSDGGVDQNNLKARSEKRSGNGQDA
jgi:hypothetical protein